MHGCTCAYVVVNPMSASLQLPAVQDEALRRRQHERERLRQQMHSLLPLYRENFAGEPQHPHVQRIEDPRAARGIVTTITVETKREILFPLPTQDPWEEPADLDRGRWLRRAGTCSELLRVLLPEAARFDVRVREQSVVAALRRTLTGAWDEARPFDGSYDHDSARSTSALIDEAIPRMLLTGGCDDPDV